jgi:hypothetical protein
MPVFDKHIAQRDGLGEVAAPFSLNDKQHFHRTNVVLLREMPKKRAEKFSLFPQMTYFCTLTKK